MQDAAIGKNGFGYHVILQNLSRRDAFIQCCKTGTRSLSPFQAEKQRAIYFANKARAISRHQNVHISTGAVRVTATSYQMNIWLILALYCLTLHIWLISGFVQFCRIFSIYLHTTQPGMYFQAILGSLVTCVDVVFCPPDYQGGMNIEQVENQVVETLISQIASNV